MTTSVRDCARPQSGDNPERRGSRPPYSAQSSKPRNCGAFFSLPGNIVRRAGLRFAATCCCRYPTVGRMPCVCLALQAVCRDESRTRGLRSAAHRGPGQGRARSSRHATARVCGKSAPGLCGQRVPRGGVCPGSRDTRRSARARCTAAPPRAGRIRAPGAAAGRHRGADAFEPAPLAAQSTGAHRVARARRLGRCRRGPARVLGLRRRGHHGLPRVRPA